MAGATFALLTTIALSSVAAQNGAKGTSNDGVFTKAQADRASAQFTKMCADCHSFTVAARKKPGDVVLGGPLFLKAWSGRTLDEMVTTEYTLDEINQGYQDMRDGKNIRGLIRYE